jgi:hypothetical protein
MQQFLPQKRICIFLPGLDTISGRLVDSNLEGSIRLDCIRLFDLVEMETLDDFILISDIEGAELAYLLQENSLLKCSMIIIELRASSEAGREYRTQELLQLIENHHLFKKIGKYGDVLVFKRRICN